MRDDFLTRDWANDHEKMSAGIDSLFHKLGDKLRDTFDALHRVQFDAPWQRSSHCKDC